MIFAILVLWDSTESKTRCCPRGPIWRISHEDPPVKEYLEFVLLCMWYSYSQRGWISLREEYFIFREEYFISREVYLSHCFEVLLSKNEVLLSEWYLSSLRGWISHAQEYNFICCKIWLKNMTFFTPSWFAQIDYITKKQKCPPLKSVRKICESSVLELK